MPEEKAQQLVDSVYVETGDYPKVLKTDKPNVGYSCWKHSR